MSKDPELRQHQLQNLRPRAAATHHAYDRAKLAPLREQAAAELAKRFPSAAPEEIGLLAHRKAQLTVLGAWQDGKGLLANKQRGIPYPAVALHERIAAAFEKQYAALAAREREHRPDPQAQIDAVLAEYAAADNGNAE